jgi:uncharacterized protein (TIGR00730 family)
MNICVFCGSSSGHDTVFATTARELGHLLATHHHSLVYGGGNVGLMGIVADAVLEKGGSVTGVIPQFLMDKEVGHTNLTSLEIVSSMHERKKRMADLSDAFVAIPGGWGTLEELAEILTWKQLGLITQPVAILNTNNFYTSLIAQMQQMVSAGFLSAENFKLLKIATTPQELLELIIP